MPMIALGPLQNKPNAKAYLDTIAWWFESLNRSSMREIKQAYQRGFYAPFCKSGYGRMVYLQCPQPDALKVLRRLNGKPSRVDIAYDFDGVDLNWIYGHLLMKRRKAQPIYEYEEFHATTSYWHEPGQLVPRDAAGYDDLPSKITGRPNETHLDTRTRGSALPRIGIDAQFDLPTLNPALVFERNFRFTSFDVEEFVNRSMRPTLRHERESHLRRRQSSSFHTAKYRDALNDRVRGYLVRRQYRYVQRVADLNSHLTMPDADLVTMPTSLTWGAIPHRLRRATLVRTGSIDNVHEMTTTHPWDRLSWPPTKWTED